MAASLPRCITTTKDGVANVDSGPQAQRYSTGQCEAPTSPKIDDL